MRLLILSFFLPGSRAALVTTNGNNSDTYAGGRRLADASYKVASVETSWLKQMHVMQVPISGSAVEASWLKLLSSSPRCCSMRTSSER